MSSSISASAEAVSRVLQRVADGDLPAAHELLPLVYEELRGIAAARMQNELPEHTLQPTALVHEAYLRLMKSEPVHWENRGHFFSAAAEAMRRILIEHARQRVRLKRGGARERIILVDLPGSEPFDADEILAVNEALEAFEELMPDKAALVKLRYFAGLDEAKAAESLGISRATASRWWIFARAWLFDRLKGTFEKAP